MLITITSSLKQQFKYLLVSFSAFTRIPIGTLDNFQTSDLEHSIRYLPWIGLFFGLLCALTFLLLSKFTTITVSVFIAIVVSGLLTGFFHEDGFSDTCDSFGAFDRDKKLQIMKDSRIGVYGAVGIWFILTSKLLFISSVNLTMIMQLLIFGQCLSRITPIIIISRLDYVATEDMAKFKPVAQHANRADLLIGILVIVPLIIFSPYMLLCLLAALILALLFLIPFAKNQLGGYTGDYLGFSQQFTEIMIYLMGALLWTST